MGMGENCLAISGIATTKIHTLSRLFGYQCPTPTKTYFVQDFSEMFASTSFVFETFNKFHLFFEMSDVFLS